MKKVIIFFSKNVGLVNLSILLIIVLGVMAASRLNSSFFPQQDERIISIEAIYPGASPREVEEGITLKIEENLKGITNIERITSSSYENTARITVELEWGSDADLVLQDVKNAVDQISTFPEDLERLNVFIQDVVNFTAKIALYGDVPLDALKQKAEQVEDALRAMPDISRISLQGYSEEEIEVAVKENALRTYGLTFQDIAQAIGSENIQTTGGTIKGQALETIIRYDKKLYYGDQLEQIVVKTMPTGTVIRLKDVAEVRDQWSESTNKAYFNGQPAVLITINTLNEESILDAAEAAVAYVDEFNSQNTAVQATVVDKATDTLNERINLLLENGAVGAFLVFALLTLFLRIRLAFWVAVGIPISLLGMVVVALIAGITINVLSLFGMILVVGILVDDGIVVGENIFQHYENGAKPMQAVINGTLEVLPSIFSAITTTCVAFALFFFIDAQLGEFFADVAFVVIASLIFSLVEVLLFLPAHLAHVKDLKEGNEPNKLKLWVEGLLFKFRDRAFMPILDFALKYKFFALMLLLAAFSLTLSGIGSGVIRSTFFPNIESNSVTVNLEMPNGTPEKVTEQLMLDIEKKVLAMDQRYAQDPEVGSSMITKHELTLGPGSNVGTAVFYLKSAEERTVRSFKISTDMKAAVGEIPQAEKLSYGSRRPFGKPVNVSFGSNDYQTIRLAVEEFKQELAATGQVRDIISNDQADRPELAVTLNQTGRGLGMNGRDLMAQVRSGFFGFQAQRLQRGDEEVRVWVRYDLEDRRNIDQLKEMRVRTPTGQTVPVNQVANLEAQNGLIAINHRDGKREITVEADLASLEISSTELLGRIQADIMPRIMARYPSLDVSYEGQQRQTARIANSISAVGPIILLIMVALMIITFRSYTQSLALLLILPFGLIGAGWGHYIHGLPISLLSMLGFIALAGVLINDGLVFINAFNQYLKDGMPFEKALRETARSRFRPLLLTTVTTSAGLMPLILEKSFQAQFLIPMAITISYGLLAGSFFIATMLPIFLSIMNRLKVYVQWLWEGKKPRLEEVENVMKRQKIDAAYDED